MILCTICYDKAFDRDLTEKFTGVVPQTLCECCGRPCLGYVIRENIRKEQIRLPRNPRKQRKSIKGQKAFFQDVPIDHLEEKS